MRKRERNLVGLGGWLGGGNLGGVRRGKTRSEYMVRKNMFSMITIIRRREEVEAS